MPTYSYGCDNCGELLEVLHRMIEEPMVICEECNSRCSKIIEVSMVIIPQNMRSYKDPNYHGKEPIVPLNIIDKDHNGNITKVTTISKDGREPEPIIE